MPPALGELSELIMLVGARARLAVLVRAPHLQLALRREGAVEQQLGQPEVGLAARRDEVAAGNAGFLGAGGSRL